MKAQDISVLPSHMHLWACLKSPAIATGWNLFRTNTLHIWFWSGAPVSRHSFSDGDVPLALADTSYTLRIFVDSEFYCMTAMCGIKSSLPSAVTSACFTVSRESSCLMIVLHLLSSLCFPYFRTTLSIRFKLPAWLLGKGRCFLFHDRAVTYHTTGLLFSCSSKSSYTTCW